MKVLLVAAAAQARSVTLVSKLAAEHDVVIAVDAGGALCVAAGVRPDIVMGDFDSIDPAVLDRLRSDGSRVATFPADKDETDLELALNAARRLQATSVTITAASTGRLDHTLGVVAAMSAAIDLRPRLVEPSVTMSVIGEGGRRKLPLADVGATISLLAWGGPCIASAEGVRWPLKSQLLVADSGLGISNSVTAAGAWVEVDSGKLLVIAPEVIGGATPAPA